MSDSLHIVCPHPHCGIVNRVPPERIDQAPSCGKCHQPLFTARPVDLNTTDFHRHIDANDIPVLVDFWAPWCPPCKTMAPAYEKAAADLEPRIRLAKLNTEAEQAIGAQYDIRSIPTLALFRDGKEVARQAGAVATADIVRWVQSQL